MSGGGQKDSLQEIETGYTFFKWESSSYKVPQVYLQNVLN
jgi:hypothetical protein